MCHLMHRLIIFYFVEKLYFILKIFKFLYFNHPLIYQICDVIDEY